MTPERAIEILDRIREYSISDTSEALGMAIKALERQIPKEPEKVKEHLYCPICDGFIGYVVDCKEEHYQIPHCPGCGQKIDWSKDDD